MNALNYNISLIYRNITNSINLPKTTESLVQNQSKLTLYFILTIVGITLIALHITYLVFMLIRNNYCKCLNCNYIENPIEDIKNKVRKLNDDCSICLDFCQNEAQLLCSHSFCGRCLLNHFELNYQNSETEENASVKCPYCRSESKYIVAQFKENDENKLIMDDINKYNNRNSVKLFRTSYCLSVDFCLVTYFFLKKVLNPRNQNYTFHRRVICMFIIIILLFVIFPLISTSSTSEKGSLVDIVKNIIFYIILILLIVESFYRRIRFQNQKTTYIKWNRK